MDRLQTPSILSIFFRFKGGRENSALYSLYKIAILNVSLAYSNYVHLREPCLETQYKVTKNAVPHFLSTVLLNHLYSDAFR